MKKIVLLLSISLLPFATHPVCAQPAVPTKDPGREVINLKMGVMVLPFTHWKHQKDLKNECFHCHNNKLGTIDKWGKETAHTICIPCHDLDSKGPVECSQCHEKK